MNAIIHLSEYQPHPRNYNAHSDDQIRRLAKSLSEFGQVRSIVVWRNTILAGHGVVRAAITLGWSELRADVLPDDWSEEKALAYLVADNELARQADPDQAQLAAILEELNRIEPVLVEAAGYTNGELEALLRLVRPPTPVDAEAQIDRAEELRQKWQVESGQLWACGEHRLIVGDCTDAETVARLMGGERADAVVTDPPYGMNWNADASRFSGGKFGNHPRGRERDNVINDDRPFDPTPFLGFPVVVLWGMNHFCDKLPPGGVLVWIKKPDERFGTFLSDCELAWTNTGCGIYAFRHEWGGITRESERGEFLHPTQKPVALVMWAIEKSKAGNLVYDPFAGSGTTGLACESLGRKARLIELDAGYVAVALERFATATGKQPHLLEAAPVPEVA